MSNLEKIEILNSILNIKSINYRWVFHTESIYDYINKLCTDLVIHDINFRTVTKTEISTLIDFLALCENKELTLYEYTQEVLIKCIDKEVYEFICNIVIELKNINIFINNIEYVKNELFRYNGTYLVIYLLHNTIDTSQTLLNYLNNFYNIEETC